MANEQNLIPCAHALTVEEQSKGGIASGIARREKKTIQKILNDYLDSEISENKTLETLAIKAGVSSDKSIKELVTVICLLNTLKRGDMTELEKITKLIGEQTELNGAEAQKQADFLDAVKRAVTDGD